MHVLLIYGERLTTVAADQEMNVGPSTLSFRRTVFHSYDLFEFFSIVDIQVP